MKAHSALPEGRAWSLVLGYTCLVKQQTCALSPELARFLLVKLFVAFGLDSDNTTCGTIRLCVYFLATGMLIEYR
jgi:hypothetical protein